MATHQREFTRAVNYKSTPFPECGNSLCKSIRNLALKRTPFPFHPDWKEKRPTTLVGRAIDNASVNWPDT
jgi:hypothetical protein